MKGNKKHLILFFIITATVSIAIGFSEGLFSNYFKEVFGVDGFGRGLIEFPRELPGIITLFLVGAIAFLGNIRIAILAQALAATGLFVLGFFVPSYNYMLVFLFLTSMGFHLYMPLSDSIGMEMAEEGKVGKRMGQYAGMRFAFLTISSIAVYLLFKFDVFSFNAGVRWPFVIAGAFYVAAMLLFIRLSRNVGKVEIKKKKFRIVLKKEYKFYYMLAVVFGVQKQVMIVFGPWVLIETLGQKVDSIVLLSIISSFIGMFFMIQLGKWIDRFGVKKLLFADAISFVGVYLGYGLLCAAFANGSLLTYGFPVIMTAALFVLDRLSAQMGVIRVVYLKSIILCEEDLTPTLSTAMGLDHIVSILVGVSGGVIWVTLGSQYIFFIVAALSLINLFVAIKVKEPNKALHKTVQD
jgi:MFS family permease